MIEIFLVYVSKSIEVYFECFGKSNLYLEEVLGKFGKCYILLNIRNYFDKRLFYFYDVKIYC